MVLREFPLAQTKKAVCERVGLVYKNDIFANLK